ncbi:unnamed protein product [Closterium sp. NIES-53]
MSCNVNLHPTTLTGGGSSGSGDGNGGFVGGAGGSGGSGGSGGGGRGGGRTGARGGGSGGGQDSSRTFGARPRRPSSFTCGRPQIERRCFSRLNDAWRTEFGDEAERLRWAELLRLQVVIFDLDFDAILSSMYALSTSAEGDYYRCVLPDPGIVAASLGAGESVLTATVPAEAMHTFTLDSGASRFFFRDRTTLTPLLAPVPVRLADPSGGPVVARASTVLPCPAVPSCSLSGLHLPSFSTNLTLLWHHRLGHSSLPRLRGMLFRLLVSSLPPGLCLPSHPRLLRPAFLASKGASMPLLTPPHFPQRLLPCRLSTWTSAVPRFASMLLAPEGDPDAPNIPTPRSYAEAITGPYSSQWQTTMIAEMASRKSTGTYVDVVPPSRVNIVDGMWIFRVTRPPGSPPAFKVRYVARGFSPRQGIDYFQTFFPTPEMTTLRVFLHVAAQRDYELHSLDISTAFLQGSLHE